MDKEILALVADFPQWKGDSYKLAALVAALAAERQREADRATLVAAGFPEAAGVL